MTDSSQHQKHQATISTTDSLADAPVGTTIAVSFHDVDRVQAQAAPSSVNNWEYFNGALLAVCFQYGNHHTVEGTAVMIGVGLALSAKHVFDEHCDALAAGEAVMFCFGLRPNGVLDIWHCYRMMTHNSGEFGDLELLSLTLVSDMPTTTSVCSHLPPGNRNPANQSQWWAFDLRTPHREIPYTTLWPWPARCTYRREPRAPSVTRSTTPSWRHIRRSRFSAARSAG